MAASRPRGDPAGIIDEETRMEDTTVQSPEAAPVRRLVRVRDGRWFGGVAAGLGRYFDVNPALYRIVFGALAVAGGAGILLYLAAWLVIPDEREDASIAEQALRDHRERPGLAIGVGLLAFAALIVLSHAAFWPSPGNLWLAALLGGGGLVWWELRQTRPAAAVAGGGSAPAPAPRAPRGPSLFLPVVGILLATAGVFGVLEALDVETVDLRIVLAGGVILVGAAIALGAATTRRVSGLVGLGLLMLAALALSLAIDVPLRGGVGDRVEHPATASEVDRAYRLAVGQLTLDLRDVDVSEPMRVTVSLGLGEALVYVPRGVPVVLDGHVGAGEVDLLGKTANGVGVDRHVVADGSGPALVVSTRVGMGNVEVRRR
jgi:phage shock protein PspC (stress-responsive transcriptional regulator)